MPTNRKISLATSASMPASVTPVLPAKAPIAAKPAKRAITTGAASKPVVSKPVAVNIPVPPVPPVPASKKPKQAAAAAPVIVNAATPTTKPVRSPAAIVRDFCKRPVNHAAFSTLSPRDEIYKRNLLTFARQRKIMRVPLLAFVEYQLASGKIPYAMLDKYVFGKNGSMHQSNICEPHGTDNPDTAYLQLTEHSKTLSA